MFGRGLPESGKVSSDLAYRRLAMVNVVFLGKPGESWILIDAGVTGFTKMIEAAVVERFAGSAPAAILLTHGHFDHIGCLTKLAEKWNVPIFAHDLEVPYLDGSKAYSPADPTVGGGVMPLLAPLFPRGPMTSVAGCNVCLVTAAFHICRDGGGSTPQAIHRVIFLFGGRATAPLSQGMPSLRQTKSRPMRWPCRPRKCMDHPSTLLWTGARRNLQFKGWRRLNPTSLLQGTVGRCEVLRCSRLCKSWPATLIGLPFRINFLVRDEFEEENRLCFRILSARDERRLTLRSAGV
jgi:Metallo-beta-lactamase superfamily